jgi:hypothetical protein
MITNFEEITHNLTDAELDLANKLIRSFKLRTKENKITTRELVKKVNEFYNLPFKFTDVRLRKIINYYRSNCILPVCGSSEGYYVSYDVLEMKKTASSLEQRTVSILDSAYGMQKMIQEEIAKSKNVEQRKLF